MPSQTLEFIKMQILELVLNFLTSVFEVSKFKVLPNFECKVFSNDVESWTLSEVLNISFETFSHPISKILDVYLKDWIAHIYLYEI